MELGFVRRRTRTVVQGIVQGVGFRPFVYTLARRLELGGWVRNTSRGVIIETEGELVRVSEFGQRLTAEAPPLARIASVETDEVPVRGDTAFSILESRDESAQTALIPADMSMCPDCAREIDDPDDRRFGYPFTNCTNCGPRFTIITDIPYDRPKTTMRVFEMCGRCAAEYRDPLDRRFHAEPNACPDCGPSLRLDGHPGDSACLIGESARLLAAGKVLAIKGLGGYHLACDARSEEAVETLRRRKGRVAKPFALMSTDLDEVRRFCHVDAAGERLLLAQERPIVLLPKRSGIDIADVAPGNRCLGVMLPYTPLHHLLVHAGPRTLVMTSGNLSEEPIAFRDDDARERLGRIADHFLIHNREIHIGCDDSVVRSIGDAALFLRRSRGYVPRPIDVGCEQAPVLAVGAEQKSTVCLTQGRSALLSQHIGDLDNAETLDYFERCIEHLQALFSSRPNVIAHDLHPEYLSTNWALGQASGDGRGDGAGGERPVLIGVQHHHAHVVSAMVDAGLQGPVIGVAFDGTGYGPDGTIWGGEFLIADRHDYRRAGHLLPVALPGGATAIRRPPRMALSHLVSAFGERAGAHLGDLLSDREARAVETQIRTGFNSPLTTSMGRLFDAVSALLGVCCEPTYEGQAAVELEMTADENADEPYPFELLREAGRVVIDTRPTIRALVQAREHEEIPTVAGRFHATVTTMITSVARQLSDETGIREVVLSGGVFQNALLLERLLEALPRAGLTAHIHRQVPPNDGGIALGQAVIAAAKVQD